MGDEPNEGMSDRNPPATQASDGVGSGDLEAVFAIYLGRPPEDIQRQGNYWKTRPLSELLRVIAGSDEFANIQNILVDHGVLAGGDRLSRSELFRADLWLARMAPGHAPSSRVGWSDVLLAAVTSNDLVDRGGGVLSGEAASILRGIVATRRGAQEVGMELISFDAAAFVAAPANRRYRDRAGQVDLDAKIGRATIAPVMLPLFTEGLSVLREPGPMSVGDWLDETQNAALAGSLSHWLWDEATYCRNQAAADQYPGSAAPDGLAFLDFLAVGDKAGVSPHPLFCHYAYRTLNRHEFDADDRGFQQFVRDAEPGDVRTSALFDPDFYLYRQPHVWGQIEAGLFNSPLEHFVRVGMAAGYAFSPDFDRDFYLANNPGLGQALADGGPPSAEWHYIFQGAREGRAPNPFFNPWYYAQRYPFIADEMARLGIASSLEHFILVGQKRGWLANPPLADRAVAPDDGRALFEKRGRRAYGEILDGGILISTAEAPRLSVIVPVSNQADFTAGLLKSAAFAMETLRSRRGVETEIIVIDSGSRDHTDTLLVALPAVRVVKPASPFSFPAAINIGAAMARGDILLVVNNDIEFQPDAFDRVFAILDADPSVGLVGAKVVLPNETLQEVGALLDRLGNSEGLGRGTDAFHVGANRQVAVDYASGCFIAFRRADFDALSGFEEAFSPGYYEDVDFALRMKRDLNKTTVVDTGITVIHYENASFAKGRPVAVNMAGALRNRLRLKARHGALFADMKAPSAVKRAARARHALFGENRILVIHDRIPAARQGSSSGRLEAILDAFTGMGVAWDILALAPDKIIDNYKDPRVGVFRAWMPGQSLQDVLQRHGSGYSHLWVCRAGTLTGHTAALAQARADFALKIICDVGVLGGQETIERTRLAAGDVDDSLVFSTLAHELVHPVDVDQWVVVDDHDRPLVEKIGLGPVSEIGHSPRTLEAAGSERPFADRDRILFVGTVLHPNGPALDGLEWVLSEAWPLLTGMADARLTVVGVWDEGLAESVQGRFGGRVEMLGEVDDGRLAQIYSQTRVAIAPARFAVGRSSRVAEAALAGVPTVMTDHVAGRLGLADDPAIAQGRRDDGGRSYADWISRLYTDPRAWRAQLKRQRAATASPSGRVADQVKATLESINRRS